jgi:hypothetical protein
VLWGSWSVFLGVSWGLELVALGISWDREQDNASRNVINFLFIFSSLTEAKFLTSRHNLDK